MLWNRTICCGSGSDFERVSVQVPVPDPNPEPDPDHILQFSNKKIVQKSGLFDVRNSIVSQKGVISFLNFCLFWLVFSI